MHGLSDKEVVVMRDKYGNNEISVRRKDGFWNLFLESFGDPIVKILLVVLGIKTIFLIADFDWYETIGIVMSIIVSSFISTISEYGSSRAFERLMNESSKIKCNVIRNGRKISILIDEIVVGDLLILSSGDKIGADGIVIDGEIEVDESLMNGETNSINKKLKDIVYRGCVVYRGNAIVKVDKVGNQTYYGRMVGELGDSSSISPLKERLSSLAVILSKIGYFCAILVSVSYLFERIVISNSFDMSKIISTLTDYSLMGAYLLHALTLGVTIIVVSVPEGLPMMVTLVLSSNMKKLLNNNVLVRKLVGIETAGSLNILFTDKTGTLTKGKLEVVKFMLGNGREYSDIRSVSSCYQKIFVDGLIYNNESSFDMDTNEIVGGNITDRAILDFVKVNRKDSVVVVDKVLFDSKNKYSMAVVSDDGNFRCYVKGALEVVFNCCEYYLDENGIKKIIFHKERLIDKIEKVTSLGIRVLCVAYREGKVMDMKDLVLVGFLFIKDELRDESIDGVRSIQNAGIQIVMMTGDSKETATAIAREVGILKDNNDIILTSEELNQMSRNELRGILSHLRVVARAMPEDKSKLVMLSKNENLVVGMTGDGVNDAVALKRADVGFAMGSGTEVAKEASDIVIMDDNILSIEKAILYGRTIFKNIRKFIIFQLTVNICAVSISVIGPFIGIQSPVTVIQMLWINMVMDTLAGIAFSYEAALDEYMDELPKMRNESIINSYMLQEILVTGIYSSFLCILFLKSSFIRSFFRYSVYDKYVMTAFFGLFIFISIFNSFNARTVRLNILGNIFMNKMFLFIICLIVIVQVVMIYYGGSLFRTSGLNLREFLIMFGISFTVIPFDIIRKIISKRMGFLMEV